MQAKMPACEKARKVTTQQSSRGKKANVNKRQNVVGLYSVVIIAEAEREVKQEKHFH